MAEMATTLNCSWIDSNESTKSCTASENPTVTVLVPSLMFASGVFGNMIALMILRRVRNRNETQRSVFYILVAGLAWTDLLSVVMTSPVTLAVYLNDRKWIGGQPLCDYHAFCMVSFGLATPLIICFMAIERFLALNYTFFYSRRINPSKAKILILVIWISSALFATLPFMGFGRYEHQYPGTWCFLNFHVKDHKGDTLDMAYAFLFASLNLIIISATIICNLFVVGMLLKMRKSRRSLQIQNQYRHSRKYRRQRELEIQMVWLLVGMTCVFTVCWAPLMTQIIINELTGTINHASDLLTIRLACLNQILDPWVYIILRKSLLDRGISICRKLCCSDTSANPHRIERGLQGGQQLQQVHRKSDDLSDSSESAKSCRLLINPKPSRVILKRRSHLLLFESTQKVKVWRFRNHLHSEPLPHKGDYPLSMGAITCPCMRSGYSNNVFDQNRCDSCIGILPDEGVFSMRPSEENRPQVTFERENRKRKRRYSSFDCLLGKGDDNEVNLKRRIKSTS